MFYGRISNFAFGFASGPRVHHRSLRYRLRTSGSAIVQALEPRTLLSATAAVAEETPTATIATTPAIEISVASRQSGNLSFSGGSSYLADQSLPFDPALLNSDHASRSAAVVAAGPFPDDQTFLLHSRPSASKVIYLDFNGETTTGTLWNSGFTGGAAIITPAYDFEEGTDVFTPNELESIQHIWQRVAEALSPFDVDVTTAEPSSADLINSGGADTRWGVRVVIGGDASWFGLAGGVAYIGSFTWNSDTPCFVFEDNLGNGSEKYTADATVHEIGHTLGLFHDGRTSPAEGYYAGHGSGVTGWAPIMGVGYNQQLVQWSQGEYPDANNTEDDLSIISTQNGFGYRPDDYGSLPGGAATLVFNGTTATAKGVIETRSDTDWFRIDIASTATIEIDPFERGPMLDIEASLYDANLNLINISNPTSALDASLVIETAGTYYVKIDGTGKQADGTDYGYSDYSSIGQYTITANGVAVNPDPDDQLSEAAVISRNGFLDGQLSFGSDVDMYAFAAVAGETLSFDIDWPTDSYVDTMIRLFDSSGNELAWNDNGNPADETASGQSYLTYAFATTGTFYLGVSGSPNHFYNPVSGAGDDWFSETGDYRLIVSSPDPDDQFNESVQIPASGIVDGRLGQGSDVDMYAITASAGETLQFDIDWPTGDTVDTVIRLFDGSGNQLAWNDDGNPADETASDQSYLSYTFTTTAAYYLGISGNPNRFYNPLNGTGDDSSGDTGDYRLIVNSQDSDDQLSEAIVLANDVTSVTGAISLPRDVDMYRVTAALGESLRIDLDRPSGSLDSVLTLFDSNGQRLAYNDDGPTPGEQSSPESYIDFFVLTAGTFYLGVSGRPNFNYDPVTGLGDVEGITPGAYQLVIDHHVNIPDIAVSSVTANGTSSVTVNYSISGAPIPQFNLQFFQSNDSSYNADDFLLDGVTITAPAELTMGTHSVTFAIGGTASDISLPGTAAPDIGADYRVLAVADPSDLITETDNSPANEDNTAALVGAYFANGVVYAFGSNNNDSAVVTASGSNFQLTFNGAATVYPQSGVTGFRFRGAGGNDTLTATDIARTAALWGGAGNDVLTGGSLADLLEGGGGNDTLTGGAGNDVYVRDEDFALGTDTIADASGIDTVDFTLTSAAWSVVFNLGSTASQQTRTGNFLKLPSASAVENVTGGSGNDTLTGNALANVMTGNGGNDILAGLAGDDTLLGGDGNDTYVRDEDLVLGSDTITDVAGVNTLDFSSTSSARNVVVNLSLTASQQTTSGNFLTLVSGSTIQNATGGSGSDTLTGNELANLLTGNGGIDTLSGLAGNDKLIGGTGNDVYLFDADTALGSDTLDEAGGGIDMLDFSATTTQAIAVKLGLATSQVVNPNLTLILGSATTIENVTGGALADTLSGNSLTNALVGGAGNDTYVFDTDTTLGSDTVNESGGGIDTLDFSLSTTQAVAVNLGLAAAQVINANLTLTLSATNSIENVTGGSLGDTLTGNSLANVLNGGAGNDTYVFDTDLVLGSDTVSDSTGSDTLDFSLTTTLAVAVDLGRTTAQVVNPNLTLRLSSASIIENATGGSGSDTLTGNALTNVMTGNGGNDILAGLAGNDTLLGGSGNDTYVRDEDLAQGSDTITDVAGVNTLDFSSTSSARNVAVNLSLTASQQTSSGNFLTLTSGSLIQNATGGEGNDTLTGNELANLLTGNGGNDTLSGLAGSDKLIGGAGNDVYLFDTDTALGIDTLDEAGGGTDTLDFSATTTQAVVVKLGLATSQVVNPNLTLILGSATTIENVTGGALDDVLTGNFLSNVLTGGAGNDTYVFDTDTALGSDTVNESGGGIDTLDFSLTTTQAVAVNLGLATVQLVNANLTLTLSAINVIENVNGGSQGDTLTGNSLANVLNGGAGNDTYVFDTDLVLGSDTVSDSTGSDTLDFSLTTGKSVAVDIGLAVAQVVNPNLTLTLSATNAIENVTGGSLGDTLTGNSLANVLIGNGGNNVLIGLAGNDTLSGGSGNDTFVRDEDLAQGSDTITDAEGINTLDFSLTSSARNVAVNLSLTASQQTSSGNFLTLTSGSLIQNATGGDGNDTLTGNELANLLTGNGGNDTLSGLAGSDKLIGGAGNDVYLFDTDTALGIDTLDEAGGGIDMLDFSATTTQAVVVKLGLATSQVVNPNLTLILGSATTIENVTGGALDDVLTGNSLSNVLTGGAGNDTYVFDTDTALGSDTVNESGGGIDTLDFSLTTTQAVAVNLGLATAQVVNANLTLTLSAINVIENVNGGSLDDTVTGNSLANVLNGGNGNDTISGQGGDDTLFGGAGNDTLDGGIGTDLLDGGPGTDIGLNGETLVNFP